MNVDLAILRVDAFAADPCLPSSALVRHDEVPEVITLTGFLARNFKRSNVEGRLKPDAARITNLSTPYEDGYPAMLYPLKRIVDGNTLTTFRASIPRGISGGLMLDSIALFRGAVQVVGVFTDFNRHRAIAYGEASWKLASLLEKAR